MWILLCYCFHFSSGDFFFEFPFISYNIPKRLSNHIKVRLEVLLHKPGGKHGPENKSKGSQWQLAVEENVVILEKIIFEEELRAFLSIRRPSRRHRKA